MSEYERRSFLKALVMTAMSPAVFQIDGSCERNECPVCGEIMSHWRKGGSGPPHMPSFGGLTGMCIAYWDEQGFGRENEQQEITISIAICRKCSDKYGEVLRAVFAAKLKEIQDENIGLRRENQQTNKDRERRKLQKQRDELDDKIKGLSK